MAKKQERRTDRSKRTSVALDKILSAAVERSGYTAAVLSDSTGLLVAAARNRGQPERLAGVVSLVSTLREYLTSYQVLEGLNHVLLKSASGYGISVWTFTPVRDAEVLLAILFEGRSPTRAATDDLIKGLTRILETRAG